MNAPRFPLHLYGHRGAARLLPENTLESFQQGLRDGATHLEMDVWCSRDGHIVVAHDPDGRRMAGQAELVRESSFAELKRWNVGKNFAVHPDASQPGLFERGRRYEMPALEEVVRAFPRVRLNIDIKHHDPIVAGAVVAVLRRTGAAERSLLASFSDKTLLAVRAAGFEGQTGATQAELSRILFRPAFWPSAARIEGQAFQLPRRPMKTALKYLLRLDSRRLIEQAHRAGVRMDYWTINEPADLRELLSRGADGFITDDPARLLPILRAHAEQSGRKIG
jgi:glycerophosphoryl diester phosphodiesterase